MTFEITFDCRFDAAWPARVHVTLGRDLHVDWDACVRIVHVLERHGAAFVVKELVALADEADQQRLLDIYARLDAIAPATSLERPIGAFRSSTRSLCLLFDLYANVAWSDVPAPRRRSAMWRIAADLTDALARLDAVGVVHRNVTLGNVLLDDDLRLRLIDLGDAALWPAPSEQPLEVVGNRLFAAPDDVHTPAADVFAAGCVLAALYLDAGDELFDGERRDDVLAALRLLPADSRPVAAQFWRRFNDRIVGDAPRDADFEALLWSMLELDPKRRTSAVEANRRSVEKAAQQS